MKTVFNYRLQNRTETCSRNTPRSSLAGRGDTPWVPIVGEYQRLSRQSCLLKPKQTNRSGRPCVCASARVIPVHYPGVKPLCATPQSLSRCYSRHNPVRVCPSTLSVCNVSCTTPTYPVCPTSLPMSWCVPCHIPTLLCPVPQGYPSSDQHHSRRRGAVYVTPCPGRGYTRHMGSVNTARRLRGLGAILRALEASPVQRPYARPVRPLQRKWQAGGGEHFVRFISFCV